MLCGSGARRAGLFLLHCKLYLAGQCVSPAHFLIDHWHSRFFRVPGWIFSAVLNFEIQDLSPLTGVSRPTRGITIQKFVIHFLWIASFNSAQAKNLSFCWYNLGSAEHASNKTPTFVQSNWGFAPSSRATTFFTPSSFFSEITRPHKLGFYCFNNCRSADQNAITFFKSKSKFFGGSRFALGPPKRCRLLVSHDNAVRSAVPTSSSSVRQSLRLSALK